MSSPLVIVTGTGDGQPVQPHTVHLELLCMRALLHLKVIIRAQFVSNKTREKNAVFSVESEIHAYLDKFETTNLG
jgi:hypothetical protein